MRMNAWHDDLLVLSYGGGQFPLLKNKGKITRYDNESEKAYISWHLEERCRLHKEISMNILINMSVKVFFSLQTF